MNKKATRIFQALAAVSKDVREEYDHVDRNFHRAATLLGISITDCHVTIKYPGYRYGINNIDNMLKQDEIR